MQSYNACDQHDSAAQSRVGLQVELTVISPVGEFQPDEIILGQVIAVPVPTLMAVRVDDEVWIGYATHERQGYTLSTPTGDLPFQVGAVEMLGNLVRIASSVFTLSFFFA